MNDKKNIKRVSFVIVIANLALVMYVLLGAFSTKPTPMPNPNGYDDLVKAASLLKGDLTNAANMNEQELAMLAKSNSEVLKLVEKGLSLQCRVPANYSQTNFEYEILPRLAEFKQMARLFLVVGKLAQLEGHTNDAVKFYLDGIRFGQQSARGGIFIDQLVGIACQSVAARPLENLLENLNSKQCAFTARELETINANDDTDDEVLQQENYYMNVSGGLKGQLSRIVMFKEYREMRQRTLDKIHAWISHRRHMMLTFAARAYELDKGKRPVNAAALVPEYLKKVPQDPVTGKDLVCPP